MPLDIAGAAVGAAIGQAFAVFYDILKDVKDKTTMFKPLLQELDSTMKSLQPLITEIAAINDKLNLPKEELEKIEKKLQICAVLVPECSLVNGWNLLKKYNYSNKLLGLDKSLKRLLRILGAQGTRDGKENLLLTRNIKEGVNTIGVAGKETLALVKGVKDGVSKIGEDGKETLVLVKDVKEEVNQIGEDGKETLSLVRDIKALAVSNKTDDNVSQNYIEIQRRRWCAVPDPPLHIVGLDWPLEELKNMFLKDEGVSMLVLTAPGGCGKTTLAIKFCQLKEVKDKFKNNIFFVTVSKTPNLDLIVQELYERLGSQVPTYRNKVNAVPGLQTFLKEAGQNPLLLVLDDVWPGAESLLQMFDELKMLDYKILVTSRSEFRGFGSAYYLELLNDEDAMNLFCHSASLRDRSSYVSEDILKKIVKRCKGFPLAITVAGRSLRGKIKEYWTEWSKGSSILDDETDLLLCLERSLHALDEEEAIMKECFMDLGSFPEDKIISAAALIDMWAELYGLNECRSIMKLHELMTRCLANLLVTRKEIMEEDGYYNEHFITQHDILRQLAVFHAKLDPTGDGKRLNIDICGDNPPKWLAEQKYEVPIKAHLLSISSGCPISLSLPNTYRPSLEDRTGQDFCPLLKDDHGVFSTKWDNMQLPEAEVLVLNFQTQNYGLPVLNFQTQNYGLPEFMAKMDKLKVLIVTDYSSLHAELSNFQLLGSLSNLKRIRLEGISIPSITNNPIELKSLQKISLFKCGQAFENCSIQISVAFPNLVEINLDNCKDLMKLPPNVCDLIHLKKLSITNCHKLSALPEEIGNLVNLELLRLRSCGELNEFPDSITNLSRLGILDIFDCFSIKELPEYIGEISSLRKINMRKCSRVQRLPLSIVDLMQLQEVICDKETNNLWELIKPILTNLSIRVPEENIYMRWYEQHQLFFV